MEQEIKLFWEEGIEYIQMPRTLFEEIIKQTIDDTVEEIARRRSEN